MTASKNKPNSSENNEFRDILMGRRQQLVGDVRNMHGHTDKRSVAAASGELSNVPYHMADAGTDNFDHEFTLGLIENEEEELREIDAALDRIEKGHYGLCETCEKGIPKSRLKIIPYARLCIECKKSEENGR